MAKVWKVKTVEYKTTGEKGADEIDVVHFTVTDTKDGVSYTRTDFQHLDPTTSDTYIKMEDVTEDQLITWIKATMGTDRVAYHEKKVDDTIIAKTTPPRGEKKFTT